ncbi:trigger factor [Aequitasia blattaphilus]|uniref:peptidylprolyl isomerase n=1 Tax=Aequitasia blattaphilus TaxID=2949332 RepID=A0ABT1E5N2_9FIRM|nr:trigger factor [Aequitasia blattaphilus]MCP1100884.1 trigger factor [Aequitasia blattaphilus]MCR8613524.1 trigger factor [Aequitasia blattaphilus]
MKKRVIAVIATATLLIGAVTGCQKNSSINTDELELAGYKGIEVAQVEKPEKVTDEDVENQINSTLEAKATKEEIEDRAVEKGDVANIDFSGKVDGEVFDGGTAEGYDLEIGSGNFIEGFEDSIIGHNIGDEFDWNGKFPDDYQSTDLAGKDVVFTIKVNKISEKKVPELTDDLVKELTTDEKSKTVKEYKEEVKEQLTTQRQQTYDSTLYGEVWTAVSDKATIKKYPEDRIKELLDETIAQHKESAEQYGMEFKDYIAQYQVETEEEFEAAVEESIKKSLKDEIIAAGIAKKEKLEPSDKEYEKIYEELAESIGYDVKTMKEAYEEDVIKNAALKLHVTKWLADNCVQVKGE